VAVAVAVDVLMVIVAVVAVAVAVAVVADVVLFCFLQRKVTAVRAVRLLLWIFFLILIPLVQNMSWLRGARHYYYFTRPVSVI